MENKERLGQRIFDVYQRTLFGKVSKTEIDLIVFEALVFELFKNKQELIIVDRVNWLWLTCSDLRFISIKLQITETRVGTLIEQCALYQSRDEISNDSILTLLGYNIGKIRQNQRTLEDGKIQIYLPNKYAKNAIESLLVNRGGIPETSFNRGILVIRLIDLVAINNNEDDIVAALITAAQTANINNRNVNLTGILEEAKNTPAADKLKIVPGKILKAFLNNGGEHLTNELIDFIRVLLIG
jgi:hypothetical protein